MQFIQLLLAQDWVTNMDLKKKETIQTQEVDC